MFTSYSVQRRPRRQLSVLALLILISVLVLNACGGDAQIRQHTSDSQKRFQQLLQHAEQIGIPNSDLRPVLSQEQKLQQDSAPMSLFSDQPLNDFYLSQDKSYQNLLQQLQQLITTSLQHMQAQALLDVNLVQTTLKHMSSQAMPTQNFLPQLKHLQSLEKQAIQPKDYSSISSGAIHLQNTLQQVETTWQHIENLKILGNLLQSDHIDTYPILTSYRMDKEALAQATALTDLQELEATIKAQYQQEQVIMAQAIPLMTTQKLSLLNDQIKQMPAYRVDDTPYQQKLATDQKLIHENMSIEEYQTFASQADADITAAQIAILKAEGEQLLQQYHQEAKTWGSAHAYHDSYDGGYYSLDAGYLDQGIGSILDGDLAQATSVAALQNTIDEIKTTQFNLQLMGIDAMDNTPYDQVHKADIQAINHYELHGQVIVISLAQQALRLYQNGKLIRAYPVTTGRSELPTLPGVWSVLDKRSPTKFRSTEPPSSPYWYPPTHINYAILFHDGGYFIHDAWWRVNFGPGTQFPHYDASGDERSSGNGSHGCVNLTIDEAAWLYNNTGWDASIVVY